MSVVTGLLILLCFYGVGQTTYMHLGLKILRYASFLRCSLVALVLPIFGDDRQPFKCTDEIYCYYTDPKKGLKDAGMLNTSYGFHILGLIVYLIFFRLVAFVLLRYRLSFEFSNTLLRYINKRISYSRK